MKEKAHQRTLSTLQTCLSLSIRSLDRPVQEIAIENIFDGSLSHKFNSAELQSTPSVLLLLAECRCGYFFVFQGYLDTNSDVSRSSKVPNFRKFLENDERRIQYDQRTGTFIVDAVFVVRCK